MAEEESATAGEGGVATQEEAAAEATPELEAGTPSGLAVVHHAPEHSHPSPTKYVGIAILLAIITGIEVALYYIEMAEGLLVAFLMVLAFLKFALVGAFFMHLKFDSPMLRRVFITGIVLAAVIYTVVLFSLDVLVG